MNRYYYIIILSFAAFICACKSSKKVIVPQRAELTQEIKKQTLISFQTDTLNYWAARTKVFYESKGKNQRLKANFRIKTDSIIWVSITPEVAILEAFRIVITPEEVTIVNFLNKEYYQEDFSFVQAFLKLNISFIDLQNALMQNLGYLYPSELYQPFLANNDTLLINGDYEKYLIEIKKSKTFYEDVHYLKIINQKVTESLWYKPSNNAELRLNLSSPQITENGFAYFKESTFVVTTPKSITNIEFTYSNVRVNESLEFPLTIPVNYPRMSILLD